MQKEEKIQDVPIDPSLYLIWPSNFMQKKPRMCAQIYRIELYPDANDTVVFNTTKFFYTD